MSERAVVRDETPESAGKHGACCDYNWASGQAGHTKKYGGTPNMATKKLKKPKKLEPTKPLKRQ